MPETNPNSKSTQRLSDDHPSSDSNVAATTSRVEKVSLAAQQIIESLKQARIVAIGASAGGLQALERTFANLPGEMDVAYIVLQHLSPDHVSHLGELLARKTRLPVSTAKHHEVPHPNHVYLIPHDADLEIRNGRFELRPRNPNQPKLRSIDLFLESLAVDRGHKSVAIVLSGTGSDATEGIRAIHSVDGLVLAQQPDTATFDGMPSCAIRSKCVDIVLAPEAIGDCISAYLNSGLSASKFAARSRMGAEQRKVLDQLSERARDTLGLELTKYRPGKILQAAVNVLEAENLSASGADISSSRKTRDPEFNAGHVPLSDYAPMSETIRERLLDHGTGVKKLLRMMLSSSQNDSDKMEYWKFISRRVIPAVVRAGSKEGVIRCWIPLAASALEPCLWSSMLDRELKLRELDIPIEITANRMAFDEKSNKVGQPVENAVGDEWRTFGSGKIAKFPAEVIEHGFECDGETAILAASCAEHIRWVEADIFSDESPENVQVVSMHGLLTLLTADSHQKAIECVIAALSEGGLICLGTGETISSTDRSFVKLDDRFRVFRMTRWLGLGDQYQAVPQAFAAAQASVGPDFNTVANPSAAENASYDGTILPSTLMKAYDKALMYMESPGFIIDEQLNLIHAFGGGGDWLGMSGGNFSKRLNDLCPVELGSVLPGMVSRALHYGDEAVLNDVKLPSLSEDNGDSDDSSDREDATKADSGFYRLRVSLLSSTGKPRYLMVLLQPESFRTESDAGQIPQNQIEDYGQHESAARIEQLERELSQTKRHLRATVQALETSNEELQATNEELTASNEEMQSSNEELQSVNEEIVAVNEEMQSKVVELRESNDDMTNLLQSTDIAVLYLDENLCVRRFTTQSTRYFGIVPQDTGRPLEHFRNVLDYPQLMTDCDKVLQSEQGIRREVKDRHGDQLLVQILPYRHQDGISGIVLTIVDITDVKATELLAAEMQAIVESMPDGVVGLSVDGHIETWNSGAAALYGLTESDAIGKPVEALFAEEETLSFDDLKAYCSKNPLAKPLAMLHSRIGGVDFPASVSVAQVKTENAVSNLAISVRDVTEQVQAEKSVRKAVARRDQFLAMLSHELRNPLSAISSATELMNRSPERVGRGIDIISRQIAHVVRLLDDLLDVSKMTRSKLTLQRESIDLAKVCRDAIDVMKHRVDQRKQTLDVQLPDEPLIIQGDRERLLQVVVNLLSNSNKFTPDGGAIRMQLQLNSDKSDVCNDALESENGDTSQFAELQIEDTGIGIELDGDEDIFDLFTQKKQEDGRHSDGLGVGLALVKGIVESHGGQIAVDSAGLNEGCRFTVDIPLGATEVPQSRVEQTVSASGQNVEAAKIFIIEDAEENRSLLIDLLELDGHSVSGFATGTSGLQAILEKPPQIALVDIGLPDIDGMEIARLVREKLTSEDVYMIAVTGLGRASDHASIMDAGFDEHIVKPVMMDALHDAINRSKRKP